MGALKHTITEEDLVRYFSGFGRVLRAQKIRDRATGDKKNFGFVDFADYGVVRRIMNVNKHYIQGKRIRIDLSRPRIEFSHQVREADASSKAEESETILIHPISRIRA